MERSLCNADWEGYNAIWEAGTEGTDSVGTGGAVAGVCVGLACLVGVSFWRVVG